MSKSPSTKKTGSTLGMRITTTVFGTVFGFFAVRDYGWYGGWTTIGILSVVPAALLFWIAFFGSDPLLRRLYKPWGPRQLDRQDLN